MRKPPLLPAPPSPHSSHAEGPLNAGPRFQVRSILLDPSMRCSATPLFPHSPTLFHTPQVRGILLDPSCSGSGTTFTRMDHLLPSYRRTAAAAAAGGGEVAAETAAVAASEEPAGKRARLAGTRKGKDGASGKESSGGGSVLNEATAGAGGGVEDMERVERLAKFQVRRRLYPSPPCV